MGDMLSVAETPWESNSHEAATAIVLAGGKSSRVGTDKSLLPFMGKPLIQHIYDQLYPHFDETIIAGGEKKCLSFLKARIISDEVSGEGPLRGIASALTASRHNLNFVIACDIPWVNVGLLRRLLRESHECDCVVPVTAEGYYEPLFAVYRKSALAAMRRALEEGKRRIVAAFPYCRVKTVLLSESETIKNINTMLDYYTATHSREPSPE